MQHRLVINAERFPHETIDNETILFDAETGHILLLVGSAAVLWEHLVAGIDVPELCQAVDARFGSDAGAATRQSFADLHQAEVLVPAHGQQ